MEYMYLYIITLNDRKCQNAYLEMATNKKKTSSHIILDPTNAFGLSRTIFLSRTMGKVGVGVEGGGGGGEF